MLTPSHGRDRRALDKPYASIRRLRSRSIAADVRARHRDTRCFGKQGKEVGAGWGCRATSPRRSSFRRARSANASTSASCSRLTTD